ncbi:hypothetical protein HJFPF1_01522 [Paramyrothecium foliicola]|nr:hypothetical protein HJFPF1_01522 [Paramyrothecium foliicola]
MSRRVGLSYQQQPARLLKSISNRPGSKPEVLDPITAPPLSSDDEEDDPRADRSQLEEFTKLSEAAGHKGKTSYSLDTVSESSDDEQNTRISIKNTSFKSSKAADPPRSTKASGTTWDPDPESSGKGKGSRQSATGAKRPRVDSSPSNRGDDDGSLGFQDFPSSIHSSQSEHLRNELGFTRRSKIAATYKRGKANHPQSSKSGAEGESKLYVPSDVESPEKGKRSKICLPDDLPDTPSKKSPARFKQLDESKDATDPPSSPIPQIARKAANHTKPQKKKPSVFIPNAKRNRKRSKALERPESPESPTAVFKMPAEIPGAPREEDYNNGGATFQPLEDDSDDERSLGIESLEKSATPSCPWCGEPVEEALLKEFSSGRRLNVRMQTKFCQKHRRQTALTTWKTRKYPTIEWLQLEERLSKHREFLLDIVNGKPSHFRTRLADDIGAGKARSLKKEGNLNPGYYGPRGFNIMSDYLVQEFSDLLKQRAVDDRVIAGRGSAAFIQAVLVAELGVQLISEDLNVSVDEARNIMEESKALGEMVHEDV